MYVSIIVMSKHYNYDRWQTIQGNCKAIYFWRY